MYRLSIGWPAIRWPGYGAAGLAAALVVCAPVAGQAQEAIPTAAHAPSGGAPAPSPAADTLRLSDHVDQGPDFLGPVGPCGGPARTEDGKPNKDPHGAVWAGVGTSGYRELGGAVCVPLGESGAMSIAVDTGQVNGRGYYHH